MIVHKICNTFHGPFTCSVFFGKVTFVYMHIARQAATCHGRKKNVRIGGLIFYQTGCILTLIDHTYIRVSIIIFTFQAYNNLTCNIVTQHNPFYQSLFT